MDGFDIQAARKAGASDADIKQFLIQQTGGKFDVEGAMKAGATLDDISAHVSQRMSQPSEADVEQIRQKNMQRGLAQAQSQPNPNSFSQVIQHPFGSLLGSLGGSPRGQIGANVLDYPFRAASQIGGGINEYAQSTQAPDAMTAAGQAAEGMGKMGLGALMALNPLTGIPITTAQEAIGQASPEAAKIMNQPITALTNPQTPAGKAWAGVGDVAAPMLAMGGLGKVFEGADTRNFDPSTIEQPKPNEQFMKGVPRILGKGGKQGQVEDMKLVQSDLSEAFKNGLENHPTKTLSTRVSEPIQAQQDKIYNQELDIAKQHPNQPVNLGGNAIQKLKSEALTRDDPEANKIIDDLSQRYSTTVNPEQALADLRQINSTIGQYYDAVNKGSAAPPFSAKELNYRVKLADEMRGNYIKAMEDAGAKGVREGRLRWGALEEIKNDVIRGQNQIDQLPRNFLEKATATGYTSTAGGIRGGIRENLMSLLGKTPANYVAKATKGWAKMNLTPESASSLGGLLPQQGVQPPPPPSQLGNLGNRFFGNPSPGTLSPSSGVQQTVPESFIRGTGQEGLDVNSWQRQTSANPEQTNYVTHEVTGEDGLTTTPDKSPQQMTPEEFAAYHMRDIAAAQSRKTVNIPVGRSGIDMNQVHGSTEAQNAGLSIAGNSEKIRALYDEWKDNNEVVNQSAKNLSVAIKSKNPNYKKMSVEHNANIAYPNQMRKEILANAITGGKQATMTDADIHNYFQSGSAGGAAAAMAAVIPAVAQKAYDKAKAGKKLTMRERNILRQNFPNEADQLLSR